jgi:hypothetical protein
LVFRGRAIEPLNQAYYYGRKTQQNQMDFGITRDADGSNMVNRNVQSIATLSEMLMKRLLSTAFSAAVLSISGCATTNEATNTVGLEHHCKVVLAQDANIKYDPAKATDMDRAEARARLAASHLRLMQPHSAHGNNFIDDILRDC